MRKTPEPPPAYHIILGEPDDNCEICKAHNVTKDTPKNAAGMIVVEEITLDKILECSCPLCSEMAKPLSPKGWGGL